VHPQLLISFMISLCTYLAEGMFAVSPSLISFGMVMSRCVHPHEIAKKELMLLRISSVLQREPRIRGCYPKKGRWRRVSSTLRREYLYMSCNTLYNSLPFPFTNPTDPSGSLYLSRMADFSATHSPQLCRRMLGHENTLTGTVLRLRQRKQEFGRSSTRV